MVLIGEVIETLAVWESAANTAVQCLIYPYDSEGIEKKKLGIWEMWLLFGILPLHNRVEYISELSHLHEAGFGSCAVLKWFVSMYLNISTRQLMNIKVWIDCVLNRLFICAHYVDIIRRIITVDQAWRVNWICIMYEYPNFNHYVQ